MIKTLENFKGFKVLAFFLSNPSTEITIKELSRILKISSRTAQEYLDKLNKDEILALRKTNSGFYYKLINNRLTTQLKSTYILAKLKDLGINKLTSDQIYLFGSYATGKYNENSDLDLGIIQTINDIDKKVLKKIEITLNTKIQLVIIPFYKLKYFEKNNKQIFDEIHAGIPLKEEVS